MRRPQRRSRPKKKAEIASMSDLHSDQREMMARTARYSGSPYHKSHPADYGMRVVPKPRPDKTRCDEDGELSRREAVRLLVLGFQKGLVSRQQRGS